MLGPAYASAATAHPIAADTPDINRNYIHTWNPLAGSTERWTGRAAPGNIRASTWTQCLDNTYVTWPATIRPVPKTILRTAMALNDQGIRKYRLQDYLLF